MDGLFSQPLTMWRGVDDRPRGHERHRGGGCVCVPAYNVCTVGLVIRDHAGAVTASHQQNCFTPGLSPVTVSEGAPQLEVG